MISIELSLLLQSFQYLIWTDFISQSESRIDDFITRFQSLDLPARVEKKFEHVIKAVAVSLPERFVNLVRFLHFYILSRQAWQVDQEKKQWNQTCRVKAGLDILNICIVPLQAKINI